MLWAESSNKWAGRIQQQNGLHDDSGEGRMDDTTTNDSTTNGVHNGSGDSINNGRFLGNSVFD